jgi:hypothetical protein
MTSSAEPLPTYLEEHSGCRPLEVHVLIQGRFRVLDDAAQGDLCVMDESMSEILYDMQRVKCTMPVAACHPSLHCPPALLQFSCHAHKKYNSNSNSRPGTQGVYCPLGRRSGDWVPSLLQLQCMLLKDLGYPPTTSRQMSPGSRSSVCAEGGWTSAHQPCCSPAATHTRNATATAHAATHPGYPYLYPPQQRGQRCPQKGR